MEKNAEMKSLMRVKKGWLHWLVEGHRNQNHKKHTSGHTTDKCAIYTLHLLWCAQQKYPSNYTLLHLTVGNVGLIFMFQPWNGRKGCSLFNVQPGFKLQGLPSLFYSWTEIKKISEFPEICGSEIDEFRDIFVKIRISYNSKNPFNSCASTFITRKYYVRPW